MYYNSSGNFHCPISSLPIKRLFLLEQFAFHCDIFGSGANLFVGKPDDIRVIVMHRSFIIHPLLLSVVHHVCRYVSLVRMLGRTRSCGLETHSSCRSSRYPRTIKGGSVEALASDVGTGGSPSAPFEEGEGPRVSFQLEGGFP